MWCLAMAVCATLRGCHRICQPHCWQWSMTALNGLEPSSRQQLAAALGHCQALSLPGKCFLILLHLICSTAVRAKVLKLGLGVPFLESLIPLTQLIIWKRDFSQSTGSALSASLWKKAKNWDSAEMRPDTLPFLPKNISYWYQVPLLAVHRTKAEAHQPRWVDLEGQLKLLGAVWWHKTGQG